MRYLQYTNSFRTSILKEKSLGDVTSAQLLGSCGLKVAKISYKITQLPKWAKGEEGVI